MTTRIGILYPEPPCAIEEYDAFAREASFPVEVSVEFTPSVDSHEVSDLLDTGDFGRLIEGARCLLPFRPDVVLWACTSGSFVYGAEGAPEQLRAIAEATGVPATSTSLAFVAALRALAFRRVALLAPYPPALTAHFERLLAAHGVASSSVISMGSPGACRLAGVEAVEPRFSALAGSPAPRSAM